MTRAWMPVDTVLGRVDLTVRARDEWSARVDRLADLLTDTCAWCGATGDQPCYPSCQGGWTR